MKKFLVLMLGLFFLTGQVYAHPPSDLKIEYDINTKILSVEIIHNVKNPERHFVRDIKVYLNGKIIVTQFFKSQGDKKIQKCIYTVIDAKPGDEIKIEAECNFVGKKNKVFKLSAEKR
ncbi:MAG: hypothetical protein JW983_01310 [Elusimicrobia bacterium]|nr:hypothetical protein [Elusimicrobiota bacterium]